MNAEEAGNCLPEELNHSIYWIKTYDLRFETDTQKIQNWYNTSGMMMKFLVPVYGRESVINILDNLGTYPFNDNSKNPDFYALCSRRLEASFLEATGKSSEELSAEYIAWIDKIWINK